MAKTSSSDCSDDDRDDARKTTNISPIIENYSKLTYKWMGLLSGEIAAIEWKEDKDAELLKKLEKIYAAIDNEGDVWKSLATVLVKLKNEEVEEKQKNSSVTTPLNPSKKRKTANFQPPAQASNNIPYIMQNFAKYVTLFEVEAVRLNLKIEFGSADKSRAYQLQTEAQASLDLLLKTREKLKNIIKEMK